MSISEIKTNIPAPSLTDTGFNAPSEQEILSGALADMNAALGGGANLGLSTPQGQIALSTTAILGDFLAAVLGVMNGVDPATASGRMQEAIGRIYFIERRPATPTTVTVTAFVNAPGQSISSGTIIASGINGTLYRTNKDITLPEETAANFELTCDTLGPVLCPENSLTLYQAGLGISSLTNPKAGLVGKAVESRDEFETRRNLSVAKNGVGTNAALLGEFLSLSDVTDAYVIDNPSKNPITIKGVLLQANSLYCVIEGGNSEDIGNVFLHKKPPGIATQGSQSVTVRDQNPLYNGGGPEYKFSFDRPQILSMQIKIVLAPLTNEIPRDAQQQIAKTLINALITSDKRARLGDTIYASRLATLVNNLGDWAEVLTLTVNDKSSINLNLNQLPSLNENDVTLEIGGQT